MKDYILFQMLTSCSKPGLEWTKMIGKSLRNYNVNQWKFKGLHCLFCQYFGLMLGNEIQFAHYYLASIDCIERLMNKVQQIDIERNCFENLQPPQTLFSYFPIYSSHSQIIIPETCIFKIIIELVGLWLTRCLKKYNQRSWEQPFVRQKGVHNFSVFAFSTRYS